MWPRDGKVWKHPTTRGGVDGVWQSVQNGLAGSSAANANVWSTMSRELFAGNHGSSNGCVGSEAFSHCRELATFETYVTLSSNPYELTEGASGVQPRCHSAARDADPECGVGGRRQGQAPGAGARGRRRR